MSDDTQIWLAQGVEKPWRVCSNLRTYGEYDDIWSAEALLSLMVAGGRFIALDSRTHLKLVKP